MMNGREENTRAPAKPMTPMEFVESLGASRIAKHLNITPQAVSQWRVVPDERLPQLEELAAGLGMVLIASCSPEPQPAKPKPPPNQSSATTTIEPVAVLLAARDVAFTQAHVDVAARQAGGLLPVSPVPGYCWRLCSLGILDMPVLAMAFVAVAQVSPLVAIGSAVALAVFLILGAHAIGAPLRHLSGCLPAWLPGFAGLIVMVVFLGATVWAILDLRAKGLEVDDFISAGSVFNPGPAPSLSPAFRQAIVFAAGLVTIGSLLFAVAWSYAHAGPQAAFARAEKAYRKALAKHEKTRETMSVSRSVAAGALLLIFWIGQQEATACPGRHVLALVDTTTAFDEKDRAAIMPAIEIMAADLVAGDRLELRTVRKNAEESRILFDRCLPGGAADIWSWLTSNPATTTADQHAFLEELGQAVTAPLQRHHEASDTALAATLAAYGPADSVWLFSDLLETSALPVGALLRGALKDHAPPLPVMAGTVVHAAGFGRFHDHSRRDLTKAEIGGLLEAWSLYVASAGARLVVVDRD